MVTIKPNSQETVDMSVKVHFDCKLDYPLSFVKLNIWIFLNLYSIPVLSITDALNIPNEILDELITMLNIKALELKGVNNNFYFNEFKSSLFFIVEMF